MGNMHCRCKCKPCQQCFGSPDVDQIVMFGQEGAGKTTLLYRLKLPLWPANDMVKVIGNLKTGGRTQDEHGDDAALAQMVRPSDPGYHYEDMSEPGYHYGIWDVPGNEAMVRMWPLFYRYIRVVAVLYVIDASKTGAENIKMLATARRQIRFLLNEDELRAAAFFLICNIRSNDESDGDHEDDEFVETVEQEVGVPDIMNQAANKARFKKATLNVASQDRVLLGKEWTNILRDIYKIKVAMSV
mmetsp:Transcript_43890/g.78923  ORF Transcript_43890/g.78923 Transcript_43890/m.78923 type:complete len:243 (-) Transcript_43890:111-839(-)